MAPNFITWFLLYWFEFIWEKTKRKTLVETHILFLEWSPIVAIKMKNRNPANWAQTLHIYHILWTHSYSFKTSIILCPRILLHIFIPIKYSFPSHHLAPPYYHYIKLSFPLLRFLLCHTQFTPFSSVRRVTHPLAPPHKILHIRLRENSLYPAL
jgi:hypothetical protein